eukprot:1161295-Pelagomonas_calceolata.AAC.4
MQIDDQIAGHVLTYAGGWCTLRSRAYNGSTLIPGTCKCMGHRQVFTSRVKSSRRKQYVQGSSSDRGSCPLHQYEETAERSSISPLLANFK